MPLPLETLIAAPLIALVAYTILGISGFGSALVTIPLLVHFLPLTTVVPMIVVIDFTATLITGMRFRGDVDMSELKMVVPTMIVGILVGVALLKRVPANALIGILGFAVAAYGIYRLRQPPVLKLISPRWGIVAGLVGGLTGGLFGVGGPIYVTYMSGRTDNYARFRATLSAIFSASTGFRLLVFLASGLMLQPQVWWAVLLVLPFMYIGLTIGHRLHGRLSGRFLSLFISLLLLFSGLSLLVRAY